MKILLSLISLCLLLMAPALPAAKIYKWVDEQGNVHYGERPPVKNAEEMHIRKAPAAPPAAAPGAANPAGEEAAATDPGSKRDKLLEGFAEERANKKKAEEQAAKEKELRDKNCAQARNNLASQQLGGRRFIMTESGEQKFLSDEESAQRLQQAQQDVAEWCN